MSGRPWTDRERELVRAQYPTRDALEIAQEIGRSPRAVWEQAAKMGVRKAPASACRTRATATTPCTRSSPPHTAGRTPQRSTLPSTGLGPTPPKGRPVNAPSNTLPAMIGTPFGGGFYVGRIRSGDAVYALIVAPKDGGETTGCWLNSLTDVPGATSCHDGMANTLAMRDAGSEIAAWALSLQINGFADWYLPSRDELELLYRNLKPTTEENIASFRDGDNPSSVPAGYPYTEDHPQTTDAPVFRESAAEAFVDTWHWSSTQFSPDNAWFQHFDVGDHNYAHKGSRGRARAVRRFLVIE